MTEAKTLDELFTKRHTPVIPAPQQKTPMKKAHGDVKNGILSAFEGREITVQTAIEHMKVKDPKTSPESVRSMVSLMIKKGELRMVRKQGRAQVLTVGSGDPAEPHRKAQAPQKVATATGGLAADIAALQSALATIRGVEPIITRVLAKLEKLSEAL